MQNHHRAARFWESIEMKTTVVVGFIHHKTTWRLDILFFAKDTAPKPHCYTCCKSIVLLRLKFFWPFPEALLISV